MNNPHPEYIFDECSGQRFRNAAHDLWQSGYNARAAEEPPTYKDKMSGKVYPVEKCICSCGNEHTSGYEEEVI